MMTGSTAALAALALVTQERDQLRQELSLAEEGLANATQDQEGVKNELHHGRNAQAEWLMTCKCECPSCMALLEAFRDAVPQSEPQR